MQIPRRFVPTFEARQRFGDRIDRVAPYLLRTDPLADAAIAEFAGRGELRAAWSALDRAQREGISAVAGDSAALAELLRDVARVPPWVDWAAIDAGGRVLHRAGPLGGLVLALRSLVSGYASPGGNKPLVFSGRLTQRVARRLNETSLFVSEVCRPAGLAPWRPGFVATLKVRLMHAHVRHAIERSGRWRGDAWGAPVNQYDMAATTLLFSIVLLDGLKILGCRPSHAEGQAYMHLWRYAGWLLGTDSELLTSSEEEGRRLMELIASCEGAPDDDARLLVRALLEAPLQHAETPRAQRVARSQLRVNAALCRALIGDERADALGVPPTRWGRVLPAAIRRWVSESERLRTHVPTLDDRFVRAGIHYWDRIVKLGFAEAQPSLSPLGAG